ncbi:hypothetical protein AcV7_004797 [Taiwanofungus camphoratus]|nr:hypothetical protein AcV7_004797 [Antrodia cinnamomea]
MNVHIWHVRQLCGARCVARHGQAVVRHRCAFSTGRTADLIARATPVLCVEMLIPVDQPLDKLDDLTPDEIDNMKGTCEERVSVTSCLTRIQVGWSTSPTSTSSAASSSRTMRSERRR